MKLVHKSGKVFNTNYKANTSRDIVNAHISNFFNKNKFNSKGNPDTQFGFIMDRMIKNLSISDSFSEARERTISEFSLAPQDIFCIFTK